MAIDYLALYEIGDGVDVSTEADFSNPVAGIVTKVESDCCFIQVLGSDEPPLEFCRDRNDPKITQGPEWFNQQQNILTNGGQIPPRSGVFEKSRTQSLVEEFPVRLTAVERLVSDLVVQVQELTARLAEAPKAESIKPVRRPRGRPPKAKQDETLQPVGAG
jgi:hypothetical protein